MQIISTALIVVLAATPVLAQKNPKKAAEPTEPITITGCVARTPGDNAGVQYTVDDKANGKYRLTGTDVHEFLGQRVQLIGGVIETKKVRIQGGLKPSANVAGQAGAIDPTQAAMAAAGGSAPTGNVNLPEFRVKSIRPLGAGCE